jgi:LL-diaminopimelate aminotransferase
MVKRNPHFAKLQAGYLFPEINKRKQAYLAQHPQADLISLGIGDTTEPLPVSIAEKLADFAKNLGTVEGYSGYSSEQGHPLLRQLIAQQFYPEKIQADEIFISDGAKCDIGRLQVLFGSQTTMAVQDPSYPAYIDTGVMLGQTSMFDPSHQQYRGIVYLPCRPENDFFPDLQQAPPADIIYFCSPNNPTGTAATREQLTTLVQWTREHKSILIYDAAYACYIQDPLIPRSIYEIEGAQEVAIELGSFSKMIGFTGVRLGWTVVPKRLCFEEGHSVHADWHRLISTFFNGASNISQRGGVAVLQPEGLQAMHQMNQFYIDNAILLRQVFDSFHLPVYGGIHAPYLWVKFPYAKSWDAFDALLQQAQIVTTPGSGFGPAGEGFLRFSAFGRRQTIEKAVKRLHQFFSHLRETGILHDNR